jgi:hypothetical protein
MPNNDLELVSFDHESPPPYAILSHTWCMEEVTYNDILEGGGKHKTGWDKIRFCAQQAKRDGLDYFWVDACCIDKSNNTELSRAINSMFRWYRNAKKCYVYLSDVKYSTLTDDRDLSRRWHPALRHSKWFTRGWTLQDLLAPALVAFYSMEGELLGDKHSLKDTIHEITGIPILALLGTPLPNFSVTERFSWVANRHTTREEDAVYCLLGIMGVFMPLIYGEGREQAMRRLLDELEGGTASDFH